MNYIKAALEYIRDNPGDFKHALSTHLELSSLAVLIGIALCFPLGVLASRSNIASLYSLNAIGVARSIPSVAILFLAYPILGAGFKPALVALAVLACPPILINTNVGFREVEPAIREAAYGMGMNTWQVLSRIELPLAFPLIVAGIRTATVDVIASAALATFIGAGGLGDFIARGLLSDEPATLLAGALPIALLTLGAEVLLGGLERVTRQPVT
jgi:osmoprotectant transport system permease protein